MGRRCLISVLLTVIAFPLSSFRFRHYSESEGQIPTNIMYKLAEDDAGFVWGVSSVGVVRLWSNGYRLYKDRDGLPTTSCYAIFRDSSGRIWVTTSKGVCYLEGDLFYTLLPDAGVLVDLVVSGDVLYGITQGYSICMYDLKTRQAIPVTNKGFMYHALRLTASGKVLAATDNGLMQLGPGEVQQLSVQGLPPGPVSRIFSAANGKVFVSGGNGVYVLNSSLTAADTVFTVSREQTISDFVVDRFGNCWYSLFRDEHKDFLLRKGSITYDLNRMLNNPFDVNYLFINRLGDVWVSTYGNGLFHIKADAFQYFTDRQGMQPYVVNSLITDSTGRLMIGTSNALFYQDKDTIRRYDLVIDSENEFIRKISSINGRMLVSVVHSRLVDRFVRYEVVPYGVGTTIFMVSRYAFADDNNDRILADHYKDSLFIYRYVEGKCIPEQVLPMSLYRASGSKTNFIKRIQTHYFIGHSSGMAVLDTGLQLVYVLNTEKGVRDVVWYDDSYLVSTYGGLFRYFPDDGHYQLIEDPIDREVVFSSLQEDADGNLWVFCEKGMYVYRPGKLNFFDHRRSLINGSAVSRWYFDDRRQTAYLGVENGVICLSYDALRETAWQTSKPDFRVDEVHFPDSLLRFTPSGVVPTHGRRVEVKLAYFDWLGVQNCLVRYRVDDKDWIYVRTNTLSFDHFTPGPHELRMQISENGYVWSDEQVLRFYMVPHWYERVWFRWAVAGLVALAVALIVVVIVRVNNRKATRRLEFERNMNDLKLQALNAAINSHFLYNVLNAIQFFVSSGQNERASRFIADFARFMRIIVDNSNLTIIPLAEEIRRLQLYVSLERMRFEDKLDFELMVQPGMELQYIMVPNMIVQPFMENSILHGILPSKRKGLLQLEVSESDGFVSLVIRDNGVGVEAAMQKKSRSFHKSMGLDNVRQRLEVFSRGRPHGIRITDRVHQGDTGTEVLIRFPKYTLEELRRMI